MESVAIVLGRQRPEECRPRKVSIAIAMSERDTERRPMLGQRRSAHRSVTNASQTRSSKAGASECGVFVRHAREVFSDQGYYWEAKPYSSRPLETYWIACKRRCRNVVRLLLRLWGDYYRSLEFQQEHVQCKYLSHWSV